MKLLIIGFDGGDQKIIQGMETPYFSDLFSSGLDFETNQDMWDRGWVEMLTGVHGRETLAFNELPLLDGSHKFTLSYSWKQMMENPSITPLWDVLNNFNVRSGFMNVPTTSPAPQVNGFFVSGSGGGINAVFGVPAEMCDSPETAAFLNERGYVVDIRRTTSGHSDLKEFFTAVMKMVSIRADCFIELAKKEEIEFGFLAFRAHNEIQNFAMYEVQKVLDRIKGGEDAPQVERLVESLVIDFYRHCDEVTRKIVESLNPDHLIITGDHGAEVYKYQANADVFLENAGYKKSSVIGQQAKKATGALMTGHFKKWAKMIVKKLPRGLKDKAQGTSWSGTRAFGNHYIPGIYLNDARFNGPVTKEESSTLVVEICKKFNALPEALQHQMHARPYRGDYPAAFFNEALPDIWIDRPDHIFFTNKGDHLVTPNPNLGPLDEWPEQGRDFHTGNKGRNAIMLMSPSLKDYVPKDTETVTAVYHTVKKVFSS